MCNLACGIVTAVLGAVLVVTVTVLNFAVVPGVIENQIIDAVVLFDDTIQYERFKEVPFPLDFFVTVFNVTNPDGVMEGEIPIVEEVGPYKYKLYKTRLIDEADGDLVKYRIVDHFEFDAQASFPYTEEDFVTIINVPYHAIIQIAETSYPNLLSILSMAMDSIFRENNHPIINTKVRDLFFDGIRLCANPSLIGMIACNLIKEIGSDAQNLAEQEDGSILFSLLAYKYGIPSEGYLVHRGIEDPLLLGEIVEYEDSPYFLWWQDEAEGVPGVCNTVKGTDSGIFAPFVDRSRSIYAINTDICRTVELRYQFDSEVDGIPTVQYSANEWFLSNEEGCYCLNVTQGINREDGCLLEGAMELYTCVGAMLVLSYPHFLYADARYRNGVIGMTPEEDKHRIYMDIEPMTGTPVKGAKRAQFNIFARPVTGIANTQNFRTTLFPIVWVEEGLSMPEEYKNEIRGSLLTPLRLLDILIPVFIAVSCLVMLVGIALIIRIKLRKPSPGAPPQVEAKE